MAKLANTSKPWSLLQAQLHFGLHYSHCTFTSKSSADSKVRFSENITTYPIDYTPHERQPKKDFLRFLAAKAGTSREEYYRDIGAFGNDEMQFSCLSVAELEELRLESQAFQISFKPQAPVVLAAESSHEESVSAVAASSVKPQAFLLVAPTVDSCLDDSLSDVAATAHQRLPASSVSTSFLSSEPAFKRRRLNNGSAYSPSPLVNWAALPAADLPKTVDTFSTQVSSDQVQDQATTLPTFISSEPPFKRRRLNNGSSYSPNPLVNWLDFVPPGAETNDLSEDQLQETVFPVDDDSASSEDDASSHGGFDSDDECDDQQERDSVPISVASRPRRSARTEAGGVDSDEECDDQKDTDSVPRPRRSARIAAQGVVCYKRFYRLRP